MDIHVNKFRTRLAGLPKFETQGVFDLETMRTNFPSWRAVFSGAVNWGYTAGYALPTFNMFAASYTKAIHLHPHFDKYWSAYFSGATPSEHMLHRLSCWYEAGMAETYLYVCLAEAIEDRLKAGFVIYDPRLDWKHKCDVMVICRDKQILINSYWGTWEKALVESKGEPKRGAKQADFMTEIKIVRNDERFENLNGFKLFTAEDVDATLGAIYTVAGLERTEAMPAMKDMIKNGPGLGSGALPY